jgi:membrane-associated phospholipid phosphatase
MNPEKTRQRATSLRAARLFTNVLNPFFVFTTLYAFVAISEANVPQAALYVAAELAAAAFVAGYVLLLWRRRMVEDFWISGRRQRHVPALFLLGAFVALLVALALLGAPGSLFLTTLSMGMASAAVAATTLVWKASAHSAVAGHASVAGLLVLGPPGLLFALILPAVLWSRVAAGDHTPAQVLAGAGVGAIFAAALLG